MGTGIVGQVAGELAVAGGRGAVPLLHHEARSATVEEIETARFDRAAKPFDRIGAM
jgi:hypothetical protein